MSTGTKARNPLEPLTTVTAVLLGLAGVGLLAVIPATIFGSGSILGFGHAANVCADTGEVVSGSAVQGLSQQTQPGVSLMSTGYQLCAAHPTGEQRLWYLVQHLPATALFLGALLLAFLFVRGAARDGIYTPVIATRLRVLGW